MSFKHSSKHSSKHFSEQWLLLLNRQFVLCSVFACLVLSVVYGLQYLLGYQPCSLCLKQRLLWWVLLLVLVMGLSSVLFLPQSLFLQRLLVGISLLACAVLLFGVALALYHAGGERGWWGLTLLCEGVAFDGVSSVEDLRALLLARDLVSCDRPALRVLGVSLSEYNAFLSLFVLGWLTDGVRRVLRAPALWGNGVAWRRR